MFPEFYEEFKDHDYKEELEVEMETLPYPDGTNYFSVDIDLPYGEVQYRYTYRIGKEEERKELPDKEYEGITVQQTPPNVVSAEMQGELDIQEEEEIKKREKEQRNAHKAAKEKEKELALEKHQQAQIQQQNSLKLDVYWKKMDLNFHNNNEDAHASLAIFSLYYETIADYFSFYTSLQTQMYRRKENEFINLHSFFHFLKLFEISTTKDEIKLF
jgi:hypothetical protein